jgi:isoaspartyl dipeptidase. metallo peptidase. MEROPS family M38
VTTVLGLLGTDGISRSVENLLAKVKALKEEGISAYAICGAYGYPSTTVTGSVSKDIMFIDEILGVKLAISDHRAPNITTEELIRLASDVRTAGMLSGKPGFICLHMGGDKRALKPVFEALERTSIPPKTFQPTHVGRNANLLEDAFKFAKMGGTIDLTCGESESKFHSVADAVKKAKKEGVPMEKVTMSSDGQGSWSNYDTEGKLVEIGVSDVDTIYRQIVYMVKEENMDLEELLALGTKNPAMALELYPKKGAVKEESDADILIMNEDLSLDTVIAMGVPMMRDGKILKKGTYEK